MFRGILRFEARRLFRNFVPVFFALAFPVMMLLIFGGIYGNKPSAQFNGRGVVDSSVPAYLVLVVCVTGLMSFPLGLAEYRDRGVLKRFRSTPASASSFLLAQGVVNLVLSLIGACLLVVVGFLVFGLHRPQQVAMAVLVLLAVTLAMYSIGAVIAALARTERAATAVANLIYFPMIFLSGATIPTQIFPPAMRTISDFIPSTYGVKLLQHVWLGAHTNVLVDSLVILVTTVLGSTIAARAFRWE